MSIVSAWIAGVGLLIAFSTFLATVIYRSGHIAARVEELEQWRVNMRVDMHEISDQMGKVALAVHGLTTLIEERTDRRYRWADRPDDPRTMEPFLPKP